MECCLGRAKLHLPQVAKWRRLHLLAGMELGLVVRKQLGSQQLGVQQVEVWKLVAIIHRAAAGQRSRRHIGLVAQTGPRLQCSSRRGRSGTMGASAAAGDGPATPHFHRGTYSAARSGGGPSCRRRAMDLPPTAAAATSAAAADGSVGRTLDSPPPATATAATANRSRGS